MAYSTTQLRNLYAPACSAKGSLYEAAYGAINACLAHHGYRLRAADTGAYNCRKITGGSGWSLHAYGPGDSFTFWNGVRIAMSLAVDFNWQSNPYGPRLITDMPRAMIDSIYRIRTNSGHQVWAWGGYYSGNKDAMHFEIVCSPAQLRTGINPRTLPSGTTPAPEPTPKEITDMDYTSLIQAAFTAKHPKGLNVEQKGKVWFWGDVLIGKVVRGEDHWGGYQWIKANEPDLQGPPRV